MTDVILYFGSNADTMIATKTLKDAGVAAKMIPRPAHIAAASNIALSLDASLEPQARTALARANVALGGVAK